jgi:hypothetical protein
LIIAVNRKPKMRTKAENTSFAACLIVNLKKTSRGSGGYRKTFM